MGTLAGFRAEKKAEALAPPRTLQLDPKDFAYDWEKAPRKPIVVGLRLLSSDEEWTADRMAAKRTAEEYGDSDDGEQAARFYNRELMAWAVARSVCDPNDCSKEHPSLRMAEDTVQMALTGPAIARIYDEVERLYIETSPIFPEASDEELLLLASVLTDTEVVGSLGPIRARRARRFLRFVLAELADVIPPRGEDDPTGDER